jgi:aspartate/methionine/tyrosine aminotransferase
MIFLNIGEPDFTAPPLVQQAAEQAIRDGRSQYTPATGLQPLRERISQWYADRFQTQVSPEAHRGHGRGLGRAAPGLPGPDRIRRRDPDARPQLPLQPPLRECCRGQSGADSHHGQERFQLSADKVKAAWGPRTRGVLLASPSNPTGTSIHPDMLRRIHQVVQSRGGITLVDEIYLGTELRGRIRPDRAGAG